VIDKPTLVFGNRLISLLMFLESRLRMYEYVCCRGNAVKGLLYYILVDIWTYRIVYSRHMSQYIYIYSKTDTYRYIYISIYTDISRSRGIDLYRSRYIDMCRFIHISVSRYKYIMPTSKYIDINRSRCIHINRSSYIKMNLSSGYLGFISGYHGAGA
jgi:hypothetical protein